MTSHNEHHISSGFITNRFYSSSSALAVRTGVDDDNDEEEGNGGDNGREGEGGSAEVAQQEKEPKQQPFVFPVSANVVSRISSLSSSERHRSFSYQNRSPSRIRSN